MRLAIAVPVYDNVESMFFQSMMSAVSYLYEVQLQDGEGNPIPLQVETFVCSGIIQQARHRLFAEAVAWDADYIMCFDSDHIFPVDTIPRLLAHGKDIVGCNYARRVHSGPTSPVAATLGREDREDKLLYTTLEKAEAGLVEPCDHIGMGCVLISRKVLERLTVHAEEQGKASFMPLFHWEEKDPGAGTGSIGEDVYFFRKCRDAGIDVWCDHGLSWEVGHIAKHVLTHAHCERQRDRWKEQEG